MTRELHGHSCHKLVERDINVSLSFSELGSPRVRNFRFVLVSRECNICV